MSIPQLPPLPDVPRERRGRATAVAVGVLGVLCLLGLVLGVRGLFAPADGEPAAGGSTPTTSATAEVSGGAASTPSSASASTSPTAQDTVQFASPSGNIRCVVSAQLARCDITERDWQPPAKPAGCQQTWGPGVQVTAAGASVVCSNERVEGGDALEYGDSVERGEFRCDSDEDGVSCRNTSTKHGFTLSRGAYRLS